MNKNEVNTAFEILLEEIEEVFNVISKEGEEAFKAQAFDKAKSLIEYGERLKSFREKVKSLQKEWQTIFSERVSVKVQKRGVKSKLKHGLRTPEDKFVIPILESLIELGGKAEMKDVLKLVHDKMKNILNKYDYEPLPSNSKQKRWENTAQWARNTMVNEGLLRSDSPRGIWELTEKGRRFYDENKSTT
ncbi:winged helix-turn-helix domain-containing protein [Thermodesulfovibrio sp. 3462-1]|uniref:Winged helix-turn-helix domain-containing protein n=1 Tax=Thermodesulfovibrio obliviosus TaxID=3118332 RepID=A0AAU8H404_9BACT